MRRFHSASPWVRLSLCFAWLFLFACGGEDKTTTDAAVTASYDSLWTNVFSGRCGSCHSPGGNSGTDGGPDFSTKDGFYAATVGKKGSDYPAWETLTVNRESCLSKSLIKAGSATESVVVAVLDSATTPCVVADHTGSPQNIKISADTLAALKTWINAGASK